MGLMPMALLHSDTGLDNDAQLSILPFSEEVGPHDTAALAKGAPEKGPRKGRRNRHRADPPFISTVAPPWIRSRVGF
jgi:hypothetical protein